jgi:hypothetical protein
MAKTSKAAKLTPTVAGAAPENAPVTTPATGQVPAGSVGGDHFDGSMSHRDVIDVTEGEQGKKPAGDAVGGIAAQEPREPAKVAAVSVPAYATGPRSTMSVSLSAFQGGPSMHLLRSHRFNQMQVRFDHEQPGEKYLAMLGQAGWTDRTESEGVWTKQIDPHARWQSVQKMEREFIDVANAIRQAKGMEPALEGLAVA